MTVLMFFSGAPVDAQPVATPSILTTGAITVAVATTLLLGVFPQPVLDVTDEAAKTSFVVPAR